MRGFSVWLVASWAAAFLWLSPAQAACTLEKLAELPVTMSGLRALVPAKINGADVVFVADSGAFFSMISPGNAATLHLPLSPLPYLHTSGVGGQFDVQLGIVKTLGVAGATLHNVEFLVGGSELDTQAVGLLGQNVLHLADVEYDLGGGAIRLMSPHGCEGMNLAYWARGKPVSMAPIDWTDRAHPHTTAMVTVNGVRLHAYLDTGAPTSVISRSAARRAGIKLGAPDVKEIGLSGGLGRQLVETWNAPVETFEFGGEAVKNTTLTVKDLGDMQGDMLLGADFFLSHRVFVSNSERRVYFTYEGGAVFKLPPTVVAADDKGDPKASMSTNTTVGSRSQAQAQAQAMGQTDTVGGATLTDADSLARRGDFFASRRNYDKAIADLTKARELAPKSAAYAYDLARARVAAGRSAEAKSDVDAAIQLNPVYPEALILRADLRLADHDGSGEIADLDAASRALPKAAELRLMLGELFMSADEFNRAVSEYDLWIEAHPDDNKRPLALNSRCWARALANRQLDRALSDCNAALWIMPHQAAILDTRGLVRLRRGEFSRAISDYDDALKRNPKIAWSLYGRGLAELKMGDADKGRNDIAAAAAIDAKLPERAAKLGLSPDAFVAAAGSAVASSTH